MIGRLRLSFHCDDVNGYIRIGIVSFQWMNGYLACTPYHFFGESLLIVGNYSFHFGGFIWSDQ